MILKPGSTEQMPASRLAACRRRPHVLMIAYACHPESSMESRLAWRRMTLAADRHDVTVICGPTFSADSLCELAEEQGLGGRVTFHSIDFEHATQSLLPLRWLWYAYYRRWQHRAACLGEQLHTERPFDLVHQVNYCGYREPGVAWRLGLPFIWGPVGGTQDFPLRFLRYAGVRGGVRELGRNLANYYQLRFSRRVGRAAREATEVIAATKRIQQDLDAARGIAASRELEAGLDCLIAPPRSPREPSAPLRVLCAGRLQPWKGVPLLIHAVAMLPEDFSIEVRVLGQGPCGPRWKKLADRLGVGHRFEFVGWPPYRETLPHYGWADVLAFTSLRDTSGTGLIEALAHGAPIMGLDHQGAADVMTDRCAIKVPVNGPRQVIRDFADAMLRLAGDPELWLAMSREAQRRALDFSWDHRQDSTNNRYARALGVEPREPETGSAVAPRNGFPFRELVATRHA